MKKHGFCSYCNYEFDYIVNNMNELECVCPKCGNKCNGKRKTIPTKLENNVDTLAHSILNFYYYFYLIFSIIGIVSYFLNIDKILVICSIIMITFYIIELLIGYTRNVFGLFGFVFSIMVGFFVRNIWLCITIMFFVSSIIRLIYKFVINYLFKKYG